MTRCRPAHGLRLARPARPGRGLLHRHPPRAARRRRTSSRSCWAATARSAAARRSRRIVEEQRAALEAELAGARHAGAASTPGCATSSRGSATSSRAWPRTAWTRFVAIALAPQASSNAAGYRRAVDAALAELGDARPDGRVRRLLARPAAVHRGARRDDPRGARAASTTRRRRPGHVHRPQPAGPRPRRRRPVPGRAGRDRARSSPRRLGLDALRVQLPERRPHRRAVAGPGHPRRDPPPRPPRACSELVIRPVGFVADHLEVLYDIDIEAQGVAREAGIRLERARSMNTDPTFIAGLADIAAAALRPVVGRLSAWSRPHDHARSIPSRPAARRASRPPGRASRRAPGRASRRHHRRRRRPRARATSTTGPRCSCTGRRPSPAASPAATAAPTRMAERNPLELTTDEGYALLDEITRFGRPYPHVVFTGGDPLNRPDLHELVRAATARGIGASLAPAATPLLTQEVMESLRDAGIQNISLSASTAPTPRATTASAWSRARSTRRSRPRSGRARPACRSRSTRSSPTRRWTTCRRSTSCSWAWTSCAGACSC